MATADTTFTRRKILRGELIGLYGVVERNLYLTKRYFLWDLAFLLWTVANTLTIVFIARGVDLSPAQQNELATKLLVGGVIWAFLGIIFEIVTETVAWERWEGTIEYTFMAPVSRSVHLIGMGVYAVLYGLIRAAAIFIAVVAFINIHLPVANYTSAVALLAIASVSFIGVGMMTAVLPLISPEKGTQLGFVAQGLMLVVSGVYYPVSVLPDWMQWIAKISPATYALRGKPQLDPARLRARLERRVAAARDRRVLDPDRPGGVQGRRALREEAGQAEEVGMIDLRAVETDADLLAWTQVKSRVVSNEPVTVEQMLASPEPDRLLLLAELDGTLAGCGIADRSSFGGRAFIAARVLPEHRGHGVGTALVRALSDHGRALGLSGVNAFVYADEPHSVAFAVKHGLDEVDYQLEQIRRLDAGPEPQTVPVDGVEVRSLEGRREELLEQSWPLALTGYADMPLPGEVFYRQETWLREEATRPEGSFVALFAGEPVGFAGLREHANGSATGEHGLTVVRPDQRGRGIARLLKGKQLAWAAGAGVVELVTWTQKGNEAMQALNRSLGYVDKSRVITFQGPLPG